MSIDNNENLNSTNQENDIIDEDFGLGEDENDTQEEPEFDVDKVLEINKKLYSRVKKAEEELKELKKLKSTLSDTKEIKSNKPSSSKEGDKKGENTSNGLTKEEAILFAKGFSIEDVEKAKKIATLEEVNILVAAESDLFKVYKEQVAKKQVDDSAELGIFKGSPRVKKEKSFNDPSLTPEEHRALWEKSMRR